MYYNTLEKRFVIYWKEWEGLEKKNPPGPGLQV